MCRFEGQYEPDQVSTGIREVVAYDSRIESDSLRVEPFVLASNEMNRASYEEAASRLGSFVRNSLGAPNLTDEDDIFEKGDASSLFAMELVVFIEQELGVPIADEDLQREDLSSIGAWTRLLEERLS